MLRSMYSGISGLKKTSRRSLMLLVITSLTLTRMALKKRSCSL